MTENYMDIKRNYVFCCVGKDQNFDGLLLLIDGKNKEYQLVQLSEKLILFCCIDKDPQAVELKDTDGQTVSFEYIYYRTGIQTFMLSQSHFPEAAIQSIRLLMISDKKEFNLSLKKGSNLIPFDLRLINSVKLEDSNICI